MLNVSRSTISRAFDPYSNISDETRKRILSVSEELGYRPALLSKIIEKKGRGLIAIAIQDTVNPVRAAMLSHIVTGLQRNGFLPLVFQNSGVDNIRVTMDLIIDYDPKVILVMGFVPHSSIVAQCARKKKPVLVVNRGRVDSLFLHYVTSDHYGGGLLAAEELIRTGASRIGMVTGRPDGSVAEERLRGFMAGLESQGRTLWSAFEGDHTYEGGYRAARNMLADKQYPDGVFCSNDMTALGFLDAARNEMRLVVPNDLQIIGYDGIDMASWPPYSLTTLSQNMAKIVELTVETAGALSIGATELVKKVIPPTLIKRNTTFNILQEEF